MKNSSVAIMSAVLDEIEHAVSTEGFGRANEHPWRVGQRNYLFLRNLCPWRTEQIDVIHTTASDQTDQSIEIVLRVMLHGDSETVTRLDGVSLSHLVNRPNLRYEVPKPWFFKEHAFTAFSTIIAQDILRGISWFNNFDSIEKCIDRLTEGSTNLGFVKETGAARQALEILQKAAEKYK